MHNGSAIAAGLHQIRLLVHLTREVPLVPIYLRMSPWHAFYLVLCTAGGVREHGEAAARAVRGLPAERRRVGAVDGGCERNMYIEHGLETMLSRIVYITP